VIETEEEKDARAAKHIFWWQSSRHNLEEAGLIMREFPCLDYKKGGNVP
jgi:hypothetical protein